ncbi:hypothetical protein D3C81_2208420 [compost metagenome]
MFIRNKYLYSREVDLQKLTEELLIHKIDTKKIREITNEFEYQLELGWIQPDDISGYITEEIWRILRKENELKK